MMTSNNYYKLLEKAKMLSEHGRDFTAIEELLMNEGADSNTVKEIIQHLKKAENIKRTRSGSFLVLIGVALLGVGFLSSIFLHYTGSSVDLALYGLTSLGLLILFAGLYMIFN